MKTYITKIVDGRVCFVPRNDKMKGFTLIEMIVTIGVFGIIGVLVSTILINTIRGAKKAQLITIVRQNGQAALDQMSRNLRGAASLDTTQCDGTAKTTITYIDVENVTHVYTFDGSNNITYQNGATTPASLLDPNVVTIPSTTGSFTCTISATDKYAPPAIDISFDLSAAGTNGQNSGPDGLTSPIIFKTSVVLRNLSQ